MAQNYDVVVVGAGAAGVFMAYEFVKLDKNIKVCIIDQGGPVSKRKCPIDGKKVKSCIHCKVCSIMHGFGGAGGMSDGKYNITNNFGGDLYTFTGKEKAIELMQYVDKINLEMGGQDAKLYSTTSSDIKAQVARSSFESRVNERLTKAVFICTSACNKITETLNKHSTAKHIRQPCDRLTVCV